MGVENRLGFAKNKNELLPLRNHGGDDNVIYSDRGIEFRIEILRLRGVQIQLYSVYLELAKF